jgi:hypothetical protein
MASFCCNAMAAKIPNIKEKFRNSRNEKYTHLELMPSTVPEKVIL